VQNRDLSSRFCNCDVNVESVGELNSLELFCCIAYFDNIIYCLFIVSVIQIQRGMVIYVCFLQGATTETVYKMGLASSSHYVFSLKYL